MVMHEVRPGWTITKKWEGEQLQDELAFAEINPEEYLGILFSGGRASEYIRQDPDLIKLTQWFLTTTRPSLRHRREVPLRPRSLRRHLRR